MDYIGSWLTYDTNYLKHKYKINQINYRVLFVNSNDPFNLSHFVNFNEFKNNAGIVY